MTSRAETSIDDVTERGGGQYAGLENPTNENAANERVANQIPTDSPTDNTTSATSITIHKVPDGGGSTITLGRMHDTWTAPWPALGQPRRLQQFLLHDSDILLVGYPKSGTHWLWEMTHMLLKGKPEHCRLPKERLMFSFGTQEFFETLPPPRLFNTHAPFKGLPLSVRTGQSKCKMIYVLRNPKDVCVSFYHHLKSQVDFEYNGNFHYFIDLFLEGKVPGDSWFDFVLGWERSFQENPQLPVLVMYYEDIKQDPVAALRSLSKFLGTESSSDLLQDIARECSIQKMKQVDRNLKDHLPHHQKLSVSKTGENFIYRKGEVGDWRNHFSSEDDAHFMKVVNSKLQGSSLRFRYSLQY